MGPRKKKRKQSIITPYLRARASRIAQIYGTWYTMARARPAPIAPIVPPVSGIFDVR
ncbi:predicted protein [Botrytis cinerea T4]|uniref:Uncharacterized protein n=1 Tax=Botryotinia fuckeliana (strain T4) TaxID=999810 RepID=G2XYM6_BOTF4|nr:predicted protein [Botrytis cinerea T4]